MDINEDLIKRHDDAKAYILSMPFVAQVRYCVWSFSDAPIPLRFLSTNGGDEDWLAVIQRKEKVYLPCWLDALINSSRYLDGVEEIKLGDGWEVYIGSHA